VSERFKQACDVSRCARNVEDTIAETVGPTLKAPFLRERNLPKISKRRLQCEHPRNLAEHPVRL
jgi:hypothetical protein